MTSQLLVGVNRTEPNIGSSETHGEAIGERREISDSLGVLTISVLSQHAHGPLLEILGAETKETTPRFLRKRKGFRRSLNTKGPLARESLLSCLERN